MAIFVDIEKLCDNIREAIHESFKERYDEYDNAWRNDKQSIGYYKEKVSELNQQNQDLEEGWLETREEKNKVKEEAEELKAENEKLKAELAEKDRKLSQAITLWSNLNDRVNGNELELKSKQGIIDGLTSCLQAIAEGTYNQAHVELFALKTYRGWEYICCNGDKYLDLSYADEVNISWKKDERVKLEIKR